MLIKKIFLVKSLLLFITVNKEEHLSLEGISFPVIIKLFQKRILFKLFIYNMSIKFIFDFFSKRGFSGTNYSLNCYIFYF